MQAWLHRGPNATAIQQLLRLAKVKGLLLPSSLDGSLLGVAKVPTPSKPQPAPAVSASGGPARRGPVVRLVFSPPMLPALVVAFNVSPDTLVSEGKHPLVTVTNLNYVLLLSLIKIRLC
jgi:hypothetical protein